MNGVCVRYLCWFSEAFYNRTRPLSLCRCLSWNIILEVYALLKLVKMCRDAVLGKSVFKQTDPSALFSPIAASLLPPFRFLSPSLSLSPSLPPHFAPHPSSLMSGHVHPLSLPLAQTRHALTSSFGRTMTREEGRPSPWFTCAPLAGRGRFVASIRPHYRMNIFGPGALFGWHGWKKQGLGLLSFVLGQWEEVTHRVALQVAVTVHATWNIFLRINCFDIGHF